MPIHRETSFADDAPERIFVRAEGRVSFKVRNLMILTGKSCFSSSIPNGLQLVGPGQLSNNHKKSNQLVDFALRVCGAEVGGRPEIIPTYILSCTQELPFESIVIFEEHYEVEIMMYS